MSQAYFENIFDNAHVPVLVCSTQPRHPLVFASIGARLMLNPTLDLDHLKGHEREYFLDEFIRFASPDAAQTLLGELATPAPTKVVPVEILVHENNTLPVLLTVNTTVHEGVDYYIIYIFENPKEAAPTLTDSAGVLGQAFHIALHTLDLNDAINQILALAGTTVGVSRSYIFEDVAPRYTSNTYEWCNAGVEPAIQELQNLPKDIYPYDTIIERGMFVLDDVRALDDKVLEMQGIKSLAIIPLMLGKKALGYVGFDDCENYRSWNTTETQLLNNIASLLVSLLQRRDAEAQTARSLGVLQTITDSTDNHIYVNDINTYELLFVSKAMQKSINKTSEELIGQPCYKVLQNGQDAPCPFCPMKTMLGEHGNVVEENYNWEFQNTINGQWYVLNDSIIKWTDGRNVHIETAAEITRQKAHEQQLQQYASFDMMTGAYNREWGYKLLREMLQMQQSASTPACLVFIDLDGLKIANDTYGHSSGDVMILEIVDTIRKCTRKTDTLCRWGGDEFLLMLQCNEQAAQRIMNDVANHLEDINKSGKHPFRLSVSHGITSLAGYKEDEVDALVCHADQLMYQNKMARRAAQA